ncbi:MAG TPA: hypothetical protein VII63_04260 [Caulobacteraceae bacterium]
MDLDQLPDPWHLANDGVIRDENGLAVLAEELAIEKRVEYRDYENRYACRCGIRWAGIWCAARDGDCPKCGTSCSPVSSKVVDTVFFKEGEACPSCGAAH